MHQEPRDIEFSTKPDLRDVIHSDPFVHGAGPDTEQL